MATFVTHHGLLRMREMEVERDELEAVLDTPEYSYPSPLRYGAGRRVVVGGRLAIVMDEDAVVTVLWSGATGRDVVSQPRDRVLVDVRRTKTEKTT